MAWSLGLTTPALVEMGGEWMEGCRASFGARYEMADVEPGYANVYVYCGTERDPGGGCAGGGYVVERDVVVIDSLDPERTHEVASPLLVLGRAPCGRVSRNAEGVVGHG